ncbi:MAG: TetR/AcrR family transcriptional regulator [Solirubrobacterales bacterium]
MSDITEPSGEPRGRVPRAVREREMLDVAEAAFATEGFSATTMDAVAEQSGVTKPMVYAYFGSKEGLFRACMERGKRRLFAMVDQAADPEQPPAIQLWKGISTFFEFVEVHRNSWTILFGEGTSTGGPFADESARLREEIARLVTQLLGEAVTTAGKVGESRLQRLEPMAHALTGACSSAAEWWIDQPDYDRETISWLLMNFAWMGFGDLVEGVVWRPPIDE